ncbi:MAG: SHOCT domain-containing protein [Chromatiales bacterium]|nr:SHOCT domain-containing protein [Chromatiales bacterium]
MFDGHGFGFGGGFMWLFWILLIVAIAWAVKATAFTDRRTGGADKSPLEILQDRLARGEIDEEEFERKRKLLGR